MTDSAAAGHVFFMKLLKFYDQISNIQAVKLGIVAGLHYICTLIYAILSLPGGTAPPNRFKPTYRQL